MQERGILESKKRNNQQPSNRVRIQVANTPYKATYL